MEWILQRKTSAHTSRVQVVSSHVAAYLSPAVLLVLRFCFHRVALVVWWVVRSAYLGAALLPCLDMHFEFDNQCKSRYLPHFVRAVRG